MYMKKLGKRNVKNWIFELFATKLLISLVGEFEKEQIY